MGGSRGGPWGGSRGVLEGLPHDFFFEKNIFLKKPAEAVGRVLARIFHPLPVGDPPAYPQDGSAKFEFFRKKKLKKFELGEKNGNFFFYKIVSPIVF